jgi:Uncharacterized protein conserved in bacteria (DUF2057)
MKPLTLPAIAPAVSSNTGVFTGEQTLVDKFAANISKCWHKSTEGILDLARACADADRNLPMPAKKALIAKLPFDRSTFAKLVGIGNDQRLASVSVRLPQKYSVLYEMSKFDNTLFETAIKNGAIHPNVTRREILQMAAKAKTSNPDKSTQSAPTQSAKSRLEALKTLWQKATDSDRQEFKAWCAAK